ncbi:hTAFII28-like protein conserved region-domain-containing protein [Calycina marina]|uniref:HTAFII28-like protein conserved region-domain-containing protein n=1 Tax=Calycina marina TaxID=1763456 RepID=A0A9P7YUM3_9HELO|nr:hTAFII28-like protein conserved region-domain-containing protein [Calycina marina]
MASPPYHNSPPALSPPFNSPLPQPPKRRQSDMPTGYSTKRRKASMLSTTSSASHPLRQTSFPPEGIIKNERYSRSPSFDTMSTASGVIDSKRKRKRPKSRVRDDTASIAGGKGKSTVSAASGRATKRRGASKDAPEEEEEEEAHALNNLGKDMVLQTEDQKRKEQLNRSMFVSVLDSKQTVRYDAWMSAKLSDPVTKRVMNAVLSQSVPGTVSFAVRSVTKVFLGEIIEGARKVQEQWDRSDEEVQDIHKRVNHPVTKALRAPLQADHLRESLRRYRAVGEGGSTGQLGLWQMVQHGGVERFASKVGGKRLFK